MKDRQALYPGRVVLTPVEGQENTYDMVRADQPTEEGTPLNQSTLLSDEVAQAMGLNPEDNPTPNDAFEHLTVKTVSIVFSATWSTSGSNYTQTVNVPGGTTNSLVALQPTAAQIINMQEAGVLALMVDNADGVFTATAVGAKPTAAMTMQATITEVAV